MAYTNIDDPSAYFQVATYSGSNSQQAITNDGNSDLKPDWLWIKQRSSTENHMLVDSTRGVTKYLLSDSTSAEQTVTSRVETLDTDGFTVNGASNPVNALGATYVGWQWKANGGTTSSNTDGSITSTVQANTDAGFSIVTYTGNGSSSQTVGHGLGAVPDMLIVKNRTGTGWKWDVWHSSFGNTNLLRLDQTTAQESSNGDFDALPSSSVFTVGTNGSTNENSASIVAYCFKSVQGYSKCGKYVGNGSNNGSFIWTGFRPAFIMVKKSNNTGSWVINDSNRIGHNPNNYDLYANLTAAEEDNDRFDLLSNGFKARSTSSPSNASGDTYIYMAFAENPFTTSTGIPTTAR